MYGDYNSFGIRSVSLDEIIPDEVMIITNSVPGAMGESGLFEIYSIHEGRVLYFRGNWMDGLDPKDVNKHLPESAWIIEDCLLLNGDKNWMIFGGGMGNKFIVRREYYPELHDRCLLIRSRYYRDCISVAEDYLRDIARGFPPQEVPMSEIAGALVQFVLKEYTESKEENDKTTAVLWCDVPGLGQNYSRHVKNGKIIESIPDDWKQNEIDGKYDKIHIRINFGNKHAYVYKRIAPDQGTEILYDIVIDSNCNQDSGRISFVNERPLVAKTISPWRPRRR